MYSIVIHSHLSCSQILSGHWDEISVALNNAEKGGVFLHKRRMVIMFSFENTVNIYGCGVSLEIYIQVFFLGCSRGIQLCSNLGVYVNKNITYWNYWCLVLLYLSLDVCIFIYIHYRSKVLEHLLIQGFFFILLFSTL